MFRTAMSRRQTIKYWPPVIFWGVFIFLMSTGTFSSENTSMVIEPALRFLMPWLSPRTVEAIHGLIRKSAHLIEYFILGIFLFRAFYLGSNKKIVWRSALFAMAAVVLYAAADEFHQSFVPTRTASVIDVGIDSSGGVLAQIVSVLWRWRRPA